MEQEVTFCISGYIIRQLLQYANKYHSKTRFQECLNRSILEPVLTTERGIFIGTVGRGGTVISAITRQIPWNTVHTTAELARATGHLYTFLRVVSGHQEALGTATQRPAIDHGAVVVTVRVETRACLT